MGKRTVWKFDGRNGERGNRRRSDVINWSRWRRAGYRPSRTKRVRPLWCQLEQTHVWMWALAALWDRMQTRSFGVGEVSRTVGGSEWCEDGSRWVSRSARAFCSWRPTDIYFLAEVFIEAANDLKTNRTKLPCELTYVFDVNKYPPKPLPKTQRGRGRPHENRFENAPAEATTHCGICHQRGHNQLTWEFYEVWFDWNDPNDTVFRNLFSHALQPNGNGAHPPN